MVEGNRTNYISEAVIWFKVLQLCERLLRNGKVLSGVFYVQICRVVSLCVPTVEPACSSAHSYYTLVNSKDVNFWSPKTYLCSWKSICFNHLHCTLLTLGVCSLAVGLENSIFPMLSPSGSGKQITHTATWRSISASPQPPWPGTRISQEVMESTNQHACTPTHRHANSQTDRSDWLVDWQSWQQWDHYWPGAANRRWHSVWEHHVGYTGQSGKARINRVRWLSQIMKKRSS